MSEVSKKISWVDTFTALKDKRLWMVFLLGLCSGFPWVLIGSALSGWLSDAGISRSSIGFISAIFFAYTINFLWSPLIDRFQPFGNKSFGQRKSWILCMLVVMTVLCFLVKFIDPSSSLFWLGVVSFGIAIASATQDIAIDAFRVDIIPKEESELIPYASAMATSGWWSSYSGLGASVFFMKGLMDIEWSSIYLFLSGFCALMFVLVFLFIKEPQNNREQVYNAKQNISLAENVYKTVVYPFVDLVKRHGGLVIMLLLTFLFTFKMGEAFLGKMSIVFYKEMGYTDVQIGKYSKLVTWGVTILFSILGAVINMRFGIFRGLIIGGVTMALTNLMFSWIARDNLSWKVYDAPSVLVEASNHQNFQNFDGKTWLLDNTGIKAVSEDSLTWQKTNIKNAPNVTNTSHWQVFSKTLWQFNGNEAYQLKNSEVDGVKNWKLVESEAFTDKTNYATAVLKKQLWIVGGTKNGQPTNEVWSSKDGEKWQVNKSDLPALPNLRLMSMDGQLIAFNDTERYTSKDGLAWKKQNSSLPFNVSLLKDVQKRNKLLWVLDKSADKIALWKSKDGLAWKKHAWTPDVKSADVQALIVSQQNLMLLQKGKANSQIQVSGPSEQLFFWTVLLDGFTSAFATVVLVSFITFLTSHTFSASQYALLASIANFGKTTVSSSSGWLVDKLEGSESAMVQLLGGEWSTFFVITTLMILPSLLILLILFSLLKKRGTFS